MSRVYDETPCELGEGPLWHPGREQLFWFDILGRRLLAREGDRTRTWSFEEHVSAAGWVSESGLLVASETRLLLIDVETGRRDDVCPLEADEPRTRSNDGRADPWGGFWIGTMGKQAEPDLGAIYRFHDGELRRLFHPVTISNAICFAPDRTFAYFTDTPTGIIRRVRLDEEGWPDGTPEDFIVLDDGIRPDGAVTDAEGNIWNARWGEGRVTCHSPDGRYLRAVEVGAAHTTCPAFGGPGMSTLFCTSARQGLDRPGLRDGATFAEEGVARGLPEPRVIL